MKALGGKVYRRAKSDVRDNSLYGSGYDNYLYPYDYEPSYA